MPRIVFLHPKSATGKACIARSARRGLAALAAWGACAGAHLAQASEGAVSWLGNTCAAEGYAATTPEVHGGQIWFSLLLLIAVLLLAVWGLRRLGWLPKPGATAAATEKIIFCAQFNAEQTLLLIEKDKMLRCVITRRQKIELLADIPGVVCQSSPRPTSGGQGEAARPKTFQELWVKLLRAQKN